MNEQIPAPPQVPSLPWHCEAPDAALGRLGSSAATGLSAAEAGARLARFGPNAIREAARRSPWRMFLDQFTDFMIIVLIVAAVISGLIGEAADTIAILAIVVLNAVIGFVQEYRAEKAIAALKKLAAANARVLREGRVREIPAADLVPGDIVLLEAGALVPADLRLVQCAALKTEEAALTGESVPAEKHERPLADPELSVADRRNMAYKGTIVAYGRGTGLVVATGMETELGRIAALLAGEEEVRTPLQARLEHFGRRLAIAALAICAAMFVVGVLRGEALVTMFLTAVSLAVAAIPEALPAVVTISLALGARKMVQENALIRRLPAVETLGSVTYICSDKTGTLTQNKMRVELLFAGDREWREFSLSGLDPDHRRHLMGALALNNDARVEPDGTEVGDPTEVALLLAAAAAGFSKAEIEPRSPRLAELPFDSERKCMTTFHREDGGVVSYTKGAPEKLLERCIAGHPGAAGSLDPGALLRRAEGMAERGLRVLAVACRHWDDLPAAPAPETAETGLVFLGLVGMMDPPRPEAANAVAECRSAGITPVMITGDHPATARAIATRLGILPEGGTVITGRDLARLSGEDFSRRVEDLRVYARVDPAQKIRIVEALQARDQFVAMTGDGVNDAPALKRAQIGIAMGRIGTDVAREASHMVLLDDNFATIVGAVREGRRIYDNIRKFIRFVMGGNSGEILTIAGAMLLGMPLPLLPIQILWINLVTDGLPGLALAGEPAERAIMRRPPRRPTESVFAHGMWQHIVWVGLLMGVICIGLHGWATSTGDGDGQTMVFTALTLAQMYHVMAIRSERESLFTIGLLSNLPLLGAVALTFVLQIAVIYVPAFNPVFKTVPLTAGELATCVLLPGLVFVGVEIEKWMVRRGWIYRELVSADLPAPAPVNPGR
jgi:Ca2+-transporting ATPase